MQNKVQILEDSLFFFVGKYVMFLNIYCLMSISYVSALNQTKKKFVTTENGQICLYFLLFNDYICDIRFIVKIYINMSYLSL